MLDTRTYSNRTHDYTGTISLEQNEWISTAIAAEILEVKSTQGVLNIVRGEHKPYQWIVRYLNVGTDDKPRYILNREDIEQLAKRRKG